MKFRVSVTEIEQAVQKYRETIGEYGKAYAAAESETQKTAQEMRDSGNYTEKYISEWIDSRKSDDSFHARIDTARKEAREKVDMYCQQIGNELRKYATAPVRPAFANQISVIMSSGMVPTDSELQALWEDARTYLEKRAVQTIAASRTKTEQKEVRDANNPESVHYEAVTVPDPYTLPGEVLNIDNLTHELKMLQAGANATFDWYTGENCELLPLFGKDAPYHVGEADAWRVHDYAGNARHAFERADQITTEQRERLSNVEKLAADLLYDGGKATSVVHAASMAERDPELKDILIRDGRFADALKLMDDEE